MKYISNFVGIVLFKIKCLIQFDPKNFKLLKMMKELQVETDAGFTVRTSVLHLDDRRYIFGKIIGEGTYSRVCLAMLEKENEEKQVACKIINKKKAGVEFMQKFLPREISIIKRISHPNIVQVFEIVHLRSNVYMFMTYCKFGDLLEFIRRKGPLAEKKAKTLFRQIVAAINYLHRGDIAHRDLKCENIFLTGTYCIKLGDFGFSRLCRDDQTGGRILSHTYCGSAAYAAPEIIKGSPYNPKMYDIWSMGCILYIMLTAHMPFDDTNVQKMLKFQMNRVISFNIYYSMDVSNNVKKLLILLLEPDVTRRGTIAQVTKSNWLVEPTTQRFVRRAIPRSKITL